MTDLKIIYFFLTFILLFNTTLEDNICNANYLCNECTFCSGDYSSCYFYHMLCKQWNGLWYASSYLDYSPFMKNTLTDLFDNDPINKNFCGQKDYTLTGDSTTDDIIIFNSQKKTFPTDKYIHCHYIINPKDMAKYSPNIYFQLSKNDESNEVRSLKFEFSNLYSYEDKDEIGIISYLTLQSDKEKKVNIETGKSIELFLDFLETNYNKPEDILQIKIVYENKEGTDNKSEIISAIGGVLAIIVIIGIIYCCCKGKKSEEPVGAVVVPVYSSS